MESVEKHERIQDINVYLSQKEGLMYVLPRVGHVCVTCMFVMVTCEIHSIF